MADPGDEFLVLFSDFVVLRVAYLLCIPDCSSARGVSAYAFQHWSKLSAYRRLCEIK